MGGWCGPLQRGELHKLRDGGLTELQLVRVECSHYGSF